MPEGYLVYNPVAGRFPAKLMAEKATHILREHGWRLQMYQATEGNQITRLARQASDKGLDAFFIAGGDGSINLALPGLVGSDTALGILPSGTANVWAQELGLPLLSWTRLSALEESAHLMAQAEVQSVDIGLLNERPFLLWAGVGLDAYVVHKIEPRGRLEKYFALAQYTASTAWNASFWHGLDLRVDLDGQTIKGHYLLAVVNNIRLYAGGLAELSPQARLDDGVMDLWLFEGDDIFDTVQHALDLLTGKHFHSDHVFRYPCRSLSLESDSRLYCQLDGEPVSDDKRVKIEVKRLGLKVLIPKQSPQNKLLGLNMD
jgi:diacylglycerol kinase (ATP)